MPEFGRKKYKKIFEELESNGILTEGLIDHRLLYVALARLKGTCIPIGAFPTHEDATAALWFYRFRGEFRAVNCIETDFKSPIIALAPPPSPRILKRNMCDGKVAHASAAAAQKAIDNLPYDRTFLNFYQCFYCGKFHVGHLIKPWIKQTKNP